MLHRPLLLPPTPRCVLDLLLGERSRLVLGSQRVSAAKVLVEGFTFEYPVLRQALRALYATPS